MLVAMLAPLPNSYGWYNTNVTISLTATDAVDGTVSVYPQQVAVTGETNDAEVVATAQDAAGNIATEFVYVNIDLTPPTVTGQPADEEVEHNQRTPIVIQW